MSFILVLVTCPCVNCCSKLQSFYWACCKTKVPQLTVNPCNCSNPCHISTVFLILFILLLLLEYIKLNNSFCYRMLVENCVLNHFYFNYFVNVCLNKHSVVGKTADQIFPKICWLFSLRAIDTWCWRFQDNLSSKK